MSAEDCRMWGVGAETTRPDAAAKTTGQARYLADISFDGMLDAALLLSPVASGRLLNLNRKALEETEGVVALLTAADLADLGIRNRIGIVFDDQPLLVESRLRMVGDRIAILAAESYEQAWAAAKAAHMDIEPSEGIHYVEQALSPEAPKVHDQGNLLHEFVVKRGDMESAKAAADIRVEETYRIGGQEHAYMEGQGCIAVPMPGGGLTIYSTTQCPFYVRNRVCKVTGLAQADVHVVQTVTGGGFGGKEDYPDEPALCAAVMALATGRPVRLLLPRDVDFQISTKRHKMVVHHKLWAKKDGTLLAADIEILVDAGAYAGLSTVVAERANSSCVGPYHVPAVNVSTKVCYTNNLFGGPFRGFGAPQVSVAHEQQMNLLARRLGMDPIEIRRKSLLAETKSEFATGQHIKCAWLGRKTLESALERANITIDEQARLPANGTIDPAASSQRYRRGRGIATIVYGVNLHHGGQFLDRGGATLILQMDGTVNLSVGVTEMGQGLLAASTAVVSEVLGISHDKIRVREVDSMRVADSGPTVASRGTLVAGRAAMDAAQKLAVRIKKTASSLLGGVPWVQLSLCNNQVTDPVNGRSLSFEQVAAELYARRINPAAMGWYRSEERDYDPKTGRGDAYMFYAFATQIAEVVVDTWTGKVRVERVVAAHDVGRAIHPPSLEGQIQGGVVQSMGWAAMEEFVLVKGRLINALLTNYIIPTLLDAPEVDIIIIEEKGPQDGPFGAKGIGEPSFIPGGAAIAGAVSNALGIHMTELPLTPERVRAALVENQG